VAISTYDEPALAANQVRIRTLYSGISAGTELGQYRGVSPYLNKRWDVERRLFVGDGVSLTYPVASWGYEEVGEIVEVGAAVSRVQQGNVVWGTWSHKSSHVADEDWAAARILPSSLDPICGIYSHVGAIALNAVLDADIHVGEQVAVFGMGVMGLTVLQIARLNGGNVVAVDGIARRLALARELGAHETIDFNQCDPAVVIKDMTDNRGADVSIEISGSYAALHSAIRATAYNSRVVAAGFQPGEGRALLLGEEFHHNRIQVVCSQISGVAAHLAHRWDRLRLNRTVMELQAKGHIDLKRFVTHTFDARDAAQAFRLLDENPAEAVQVVLRFET
jgi:threonine dehydrogenase-like Zn-dependent dehydrogenase